MKNLAIIGSTGSIGTQALSIAREQKDIRVIALSAGRNIDLLERQMREFHPKFVSVADPDAAASLRIRTRDLSIPVGDGMDGLIETAVMPEASMLLTAVVGMIGIRPTIAAMRAGKDIALANKETLVTAGHIIMPLAKEYGVRILPVDSEHSAIFQSLQGNAQNRIEKILLTASGGPFRGRTPDALRAVRAEDALKHPNWSMGRKITIDSATMVNKGLEIMEAHWLFDTPPDQIEVVVHPESIIHSAVQYEDGAVIAQLGLPDMKIPIQYALYYPKRRPMAGKKLDLFALGSMSFERPDTETFYTLTMAREALSKGGNTPTVFNAANERAVAQFLAGEISFLQIMEIIRSCMDAIAYVPDPTVEQILETEAMVYDYIGQLIKGAHI